jgi:hypothetical protein
MYDSLFFSVYGRVCRCVGRSDCPTTTPTSVNCIALISESIAMSVRSSTSPVLRSNTVTAKDAGERVLTGKRCNQTSFKKGMSVKGVCVPIHLPERILPQSVYGPVISSRILSTCTGALIPRKSIWDTDERKNGSRVLIR